MTEEAQVDGQPFEANSVEQEAGQAQTNEFAIPDAYKDKPWAEKIKSPEDLWKSLEGAQTLIGKKAVVPDHSKATENELEQFYSQLRPKEKAEYQFSEQTPEEMKSVYADWAYEAGLSQKQLSTLAAKLDEAGKARHEQEHSVENFEALLKESFGNEYKTIGATAHKIALKNMSDNDKALFDAMPNQYAAMVYRLVANLEKAYGAKEGGVAGGATADKGAGKEERIEFLKKKMFELKGKQFAGNEYEKVQDEYFRLMGVRK
jgi:hypothetical protein